MRLLYVAVVGRAAKDLHDAGASRPSAEGRLAVRARADGSEIHGRAAARVQVSSSVHLGETMKKTVKEASTGNAELTAAYIALMAEARRVLQAVKVAALTHAAVQFKELAENGGSVTELGSTASEEMKEASRRCSDEARAQLGHVTG